MVASNPEEDSLFGDFLLFVLVVDVFEVGLNLHEFGAALFNILLVLRVFLRLLKRVQLEPDL